MSEQRPGNPAPPAARPRTQSRLRGEALPGIPVAAEARQTIGRYEVIKTLGRGAMGVVYKARDPLLDRVVAVKTIIQPNGVGRRTRSAYVERFQREAKAAAKMQHPAIVTIFDVGVDEEAGAPFMVLEYLPGESLADRLDRVRFPLARAVQTAMDLASALGFAHRQRIVHRDVKPANVLHAGENRWKLADFGIARLPDSDLTQIGIFMGTPGYSPPEAIRDGQYTPQADVFAWGAVLYELLSGRIPYEGPDTRTTNQLVVKGEAYAPTEHDSSIPEPLVEVVMHALRGDAETRFRDGAEAEAALRDAWQECLTEGLVHPAVLAADEMVHDKAPTRMHVAPAGRSESSRSARSTMPSNPAHAKIVATGTAVPEGTVVDSLPPPPNKSKVPSSVKGVALSEARNLVPRERAGDDDPTMIHRRDDGKIGPENPRAKANAAVEKKAIVDDVHERPTAVVATLDPMKMRSVPAIKVPPAAAEDPADVAPTKPAPTRRRDKRSTGRMGGGTKFALSATVLLLLGGIALVVLYAMNIISL